MCLFSLGSAINKTDRNKLINQKMVESGVMHPWPCYWLAKLKNVFLHFF